MRLAPLLSVCCLCGLFASPGQSHDGHDHDEAVPAVSDERLYLPTAMPDRILLSWKSDPARSQAITWRTDTSVQHAFVELARASDGPLFVAAAKRHLAKTEAHRTDLGTVHYHAINLNDLTPDTLYVYRLGDGTNWSEWIHFRTAKDGPEPFTFIYFGDAQNDVKSHWSRVFREAFADAPRAGFMLHAGDLINRGNRDVEWGEWCSAGGWVNATIPTIAVPGNHEYDIDRTVPLPETAEEQKKLPRSLTSRWQVRFEFPDNGPAEFSQHLAETAYFLDYQGVRMVALNSMEDFAVQAKWLDRVLSDNPCRWTIVSPSSGLLRQRGARQSRAQGRVAADLRQARRRHRAPGARSLVRPYRSAKIRPQRHQRDRLSR